MSSKKRVLNEAAKWGAILGVIMGISRIYELNLIMGDSIDQYVTLSLEWIASIFVYFMIVIIANKGKNRGFSQVVNFSIVMSIFAAIIVGATSHIYIVEFLGGYSKYLANSIAAMQSVLGEVQTLALANGADADSVGESMNLFTQFVGDSDKLIKDAAMNRPTIFSSVFSMATNYILSGAIFGCIASIFVAKRGDN